MICKAKAEEMIVDLREKLTNHLGIDIYIGDDIIREWLDKYIGIAEENFKFPETDLILDTSEGVV